METPARFHQFDPPHLTKAEAAMYQEAGILAFRGRNTNGSYNCIVERAKIVLAGEDTNFRKLDERHVDKLEADFNQKAIRNPLLVLRKNSQGREGKEASTVDGRHTVYLIGRMDKKDEFEGQFKYISADVFIELEVHEMARLFKQLNQDGKRMGPWENFHAAFKGRDEKAMKVMALCKKFRLTTPIDSGIPPSYEVDVDFKDSVSPLNEAAKKDEARGQDSKFLENFLRLVSVFKDPTSDRLYRPVSHCYFLRGLIDLLDMYEGEDIGQLERWLKRSSPEEYRKAARCNASEVGRIDRQHYRRAFESSIPVKVRERANCEA